MTSAKTPISTILIIEYEGDFKFGDELPNGKTAVIFRNKQGNLLVTEKTKKWMAVRLDDRIAIIEYEINSKIPSTRYINISVDFKSADILDVFFAIKDTESLI